MRHLVRLLLFVLLAGCALPVLAQHFVEGPRLQLHSPTHATLTFELSHKALAYVHVANNANFNNARIVQPAYESEDGTAFSFELSGLSPERSYFIDVQLNGRSKQTLPFETISYEQHYAQVKAGSNKSIVFDSDPPTDERPAADANERSDELTSNTEDHIKEKNQLLADIPIDTPVLTDEAVESLARNAEPPDSDTETEEATADDPGLPVADDLDEGLDLNLDDEFEDVEDVEWEEASDASAEEQAESETLMDKEEQDNGPSSSPDEPAFELKPNAADHLVEDLPEFKPPINAKDYGLVIQPTLGHSLIKIYMSKREELSPQSEVVIFDSRGVDRKRTAQVLRENGIQGVDLRNFDRGKYYVRLEALDGTAIWGEFELR
ncbi:MAG: hypothetical protein ACOCZ8_00625 [Bacteroidota bacterium]